MKYPVVLLDLDGTLLDFDAASRFSLTRLVPGLSEEDIARFEEINSACWRELEKGIITRDQLSRKRFEIFFREMGIDRDPLEANTLFRAGLSESAVLMPGALELCEKLSRIREIHLVTNGFVETQARRLKASGLDRFFKKVFTSQGIG